MQNKFVAAVSQVHIEKVFVASVTPGESVYSALQRGDLSRLLDSVDHAVVMWAPQGRSAERSCVVMLLEDAAQGSEGTVAQDAVVYRVAFKATLDCRSFSFAKDTDRFDAVRKLTSCFM